MSISTSSSRPRCDHDDCMICLYPLLAQDNDNEAAAGTAANKEFEGEKQDPPASTDEQEQDQEIGAVFPCGHCFHVSCYAQWKGERCPNCNQIASLFSKIYITAPANNHNNDMPLSSDERRELEQYRRKEREEEQDRLVLRDLQMREKEDPQGAKIMMTMMMMMQAKDLRKAERELIETKEDFDSTKEIMSLTHSELEGAIQEMQEYKAKAETLQDELDMLKRVRWENANHRNQEHKSQINALKAKYEKAKEKIVQKNRQLARRNKELAAKRKLISAHKMELAAKGQEHERMCEKTKEALRLKEKELEILRELDSLGDSFASFPSTTNDDNSLRWS